MKTADATRLHQTSLGHGARARGLLAVVTAAMLSGACSGDLGLLSGAGDQFANALSPTKVSAADTAKQQQSELEKAVEYWGAEHKARPTELKAGLNYARNLKAAGHKEQAFGVVQSLALVHGDSKELASEYGRLALDAGQVQVAQQLLTMADDPMKPDWRVVSALGTVQAKLGKYSDAIPFYERALTLSPNQPSVLNNLAMAHAANGEPDRAEQMLRGLANNGGDTKVRQNLALVLGLQNKHADAQMVSASTDLPASDASANTDYLRRMVKETAPAPQPMITAATTQVTSPGKTAAPWTAPTAKRGTTVASSAKPAQMRKSAEPDAVGAPAGNWDTTVARAQ